MVLNHADYMREWRKKNRERWREIKRNSRAKNPESHRATNAAWKAANPEKRKAHSAVQVAINSGRLVRDDCESCGSGNSQAHHDDYSKPLDVRWLCAVCHADEHGWNAA